MMYRPIITFELTSLGRPLPCDVYKRLTNLEEKVLFLEGMSPEYFSQIVSSRVNRLYFLRLKFQKFYKYGKIVREAEIFFIMNFCIIMNYLSVKYNKTYPGEN